MIFFVVTLVWPKNATGSLKIQAWIFTFFGLWLLATQIPYTDFLANRSAKIDAFLAGRQLPAQVVQAALAAAGESAKYSKLHPGTSYRLAHVRDHVANFFPLSRPSCHFPLDFTALLYRPCIRSLCSCSKTQTVASRNDFSATHC